MQGEGFSGWRRTRSTSTTVNLLLFCPSPSVSFIDAVVIKSERITYYGNIIADGSLSFTKELSDGLIEMASKHCKVFIARTFTKRLPIMRIAAYFPQPEDFKIQPTKTIVFEDYSFYIWQF
jgi:hypothetical protein